MSENENIGYYLQEAEETGKEIAEAYDKGFLERLKKSETAIVRAFNERYQAINYQHQYGLISSEEYFKKLERARDAYFARDTQEWHKYTKKINEYRSAALEEYRQDVEKSLEGLLEVTAKGKEKLLDYAGGDKGFDTHKTTVYNYWPNGDPLVMTDYTLTDYEKEIEKLKNFNTSLTSLKERAADINPEVLSMFLGDMREMSVDDAKILADLLLEANDEDFNRHFALYDERNQLAESISASYYADDYNSLAQEVKKELGEAFGVLPEEFFKCGQLVGENFTTAFKEKVEKLFTDFVLEISTIESSGGQNVNTDNSVFSPVYYFFGDRATTSRTRIQAKNDALYSYMQGGK